MADEQEFSSEDFETWKEHPITKAMLKRARESLEPAQHAVNMAASESADAKVRGAFYRLLTIQQQIQALEGT